MEKLWLSARRPSDSRCQNVLSRSICTHQTTVAWSARSDVVPLQCKENIRQSNSRAPVTPTLKCSPERTATSQLKEGRKGQMRPFQQVSSTALGTEIPHRPARLVHLGTQEG